MEPDDDDQESGNVVPQFEVQDDGIIEFMHNINIMTFPDEIIRTNKQKGQIVAFTQHSVWINRAYRTTIGVVGCIGQTMALQKLLICMKQMTFGYSTG